MVHAVGERVLAYDSEDHLYYATIVKVGDQPAADECKYFCKFDDWDEQYNEWVPRHRVLEIDTKNKKLKAKLDAEQGIIACARQCAH